ncbi:Retrovirus-related Pol polyprotein from transposon 17.6 [Senna tora]|uniref:Retrovirus-related Pol polyprotein from transposon 17.6 n=1 Tax=Senna tora TaxID=362788 RepID=A0A834TGX0_9FABA|nr:Retrovirus-related Pol polyprotein from transposon 17.6 [Senna tora]
MVRWLVPKDLKALMGFLGITGYYTRFVKNYSKIAAPLTNLLKKDAFKWNTEAQKAFKELKNAMTTVPVLAMPNFSQHFEIETNASSTGSQVPVDQQKWASKLMGYNFEIHYKPGVENKAADALSRKGEDMELKAFSVWRMVTDIPGTTNASFG